MDGVDPVDAFYRVLWTEKEYTFCRLLSVGPRHGSAVCGTMWNPGSCHGGSGNAEGSTATQGLPDTRDSKHLVIFQSLKLNFLQAQSSIAINYHQLSLEHIRAKHLTTKSENPPWISCEVYPRHIPGPWSAERALECWEHPQTGKTWSFRVFLRCFFFFGISESSHVTLILQRWIESCFFSKSQSWDAGCLVKRFSCCDPCFFEACLWLVEEFYISSWDDETLQLRFRIHEVSDVERWQRYVSRPSFP